MEIYFGPPCNGYAFNCHLVYLAIPGTPPLCVKKQNKICMFYLYATAKSEIHICSNKHETGLVVCLDLIFSFYIRNGVHLSKHYRWQEADIDIDILRFLMVTISKPFKMMDGTKIYHVLTY